MEHTDTFSHLGLDPDQWTFDKAVCVDGQPGDAIFFHVNTVHGSPPNTNDGPRPVFIHRYRRADDFVVISGSSVANRRRVAEAKDQNQLGLMVRGSRKQLRPH